MATTILEAHAPVPFAVRDCALINIATGVAAETLKDFREALEKIPAGSIYHHFWGRLMRAQFDEPEYNNDFASWAYRGLHDKPLAERLSMVIPSDYEDLEDLRGEILEVLAQHLEEEAPGVWAVAEDPFQFLHAQIVVFDTGLRFGGPEDLVPYLPSLSTGSIYYHFIDARNRTQARCNDFSAWLEGFGEPHRELAERLNGLDPYFSSLKEIRHMVSETFRTHFEATP